MNRVIIRILQYLSIGFMWLFALGIISLVIWLVVVANGWKDAENWSLVISIVMIPVYLIVFFTLNYVFIELQRGRPEAGSERKGHLPQQPAVKANSQPHA